jgi:aromatic ring-cleaving dioxygenase
VYYTLDKLPTMEAVYRDIQAAFPDAQMYPPVDKPIGPHPTPMFEFHVAPAAAAGVMGWLEKNGRGLRALVHPHTGDGLADHTRHARWVGEPLALRTDIFRH